MTRPDSGFGHYLRDMVYGALDGVITTMAVLAGAEGASLSMRVGLILGMANLLGDGISMGASNYLGMRSEIEQTGGSVAAEAPWRHGPRDRGGVHRRRIGSTRRLRAGGLDGGPRVPRRRRLAAGALLGPGGAGPVRPEDGGPQRDRDAGGGSAGGRAAYLVGLVASSLAR
jgi:hypothetical protein